MKCVFTLLACMLISLRVMRPTSSHARFRGGGWMLSSKPLYFAFTKAF